MLAKNAMYGLIIGVSLALPILIIATRNIITGFLATFSMCCSTVCVVGVITLGGWKFDVSVTPRYCEMHGQVLAIPLTDPRYGARRPQNCDRKRVPGYAQGNTFR